jgi:hypothetical protein
MDWETLLKAYPTQTDIILGVRYLRERVENAMAGVDAPKLDGPCRAMDDLGDFVPVIAPACALAWKDITGASPSFDMAEALKSLAVEGDTPEMAQADRERLEAIAQNAFSRLLGLLREKNPHLIPQEWNQGDCPFCGTYARIGFDEEADPPLPLVRPFLAVPPPQVPVVRERRLYDPRLFRGRRYRRRAGPLLQGMQPLSQGRGQKGEVRP